MIEAGRKILAGARIRRLRRELGLSQSGMAGELGISTSYLNLMERNQRPVTAQVLIRLAEAYNVDPRSFAREEETRLAAEMEEIFSDPVFRAVTVSKDELRELTTLAPSIGEAIQKLYSAYADLRSSDSGAGPVSDLDHDRSEGVSSDNPVDRVRDLIQSANNHFPELEEAAETVWNEAVPNGEPLFDALCQRMKANHGIKVQIFPVEVMPGSIRRFDFHRRRLMLSEMSDQAGRTFQVAYQVGLTEFGSVIGSIADRFEPQDGPAKALLRVSLANYFAAALMMPYAKFLEAAESVDYDTDVLGARFQASFEQVAHRLTTLGRSGARGIPFFLIRIDQAGNVSKRFSAGSFPFSRFGGTCPLWNIHEAFQVSGKILTQIIEMPDGAKWFSMARQSRRASTGWGEAESQFVIGLGCELKYAHRLTYARGIDLKSTVTTPIGVNCRLCERPNCAQRAAPPMRRRLRIDEAVRNISPFSFGD